MDSPATTAAIAAVIDAHTPTGYEGNVTCWCGPRFDSWVEHSEHVAAFILAALNLTEEWGNTWAGQGPAINRTRAEAEEALTYAREKFPDADYPHDVVHRLVTPWVPVQP